MHRPDGKISRRHLLTRGAQVALMAAAAGPLAPLLAAPGSRWFKIGACEWTWARRDPASFDVAKKIGLDGVQVNMGSVGDGMHLRKPEVQQAYLAAAKRTGLEIASLAIGEMNNVPLEERSPGGASGWSIASASARPSVCTIVMPACFYKGELDMSKTAEIDHLVEVLKNVARKAEKQGVLIGVENYLSAEDNLKIIDRVGSPAVKVYYDVGNSTDKGRDVLKEIPILGKLICQFHAKDGGSMLGQGRIDFKQVRKALDDIEYSGWIQIEAAAPHGLYQDYAADYKYLREIYPERE